MTPAERRYRKPPKQAICRRYTVDGVRWRELECGHHQVEQPGGRARLAETALCRECAGLSADENADGASVPRAEGGT